MTYVVPPKPGPLQVIAIGLIIVQLGNLVWAHSEALRERKEWLKIDQSVKKKIQEALPPRRHFWDAGPPSWISEHVGAGSLRARHRVVPDQPVYDIIKQDVAQGGMVSHHPLCGPCGARI